MKDRTEVSEHCTRSRNSVGIGMKLQAAIEEDALPGGGDDTPHDKVISKGTSIRDTAKVKVARGTAVYCKCIKKHRLTVKVPASCRSGCCRGT